MRYRILRFPEGKGKAVTFSYDDGCRQDIRFAKTLDEYGLKCTFNINSCRVNRENTGTGPLSKDEIQEYILDKGHEVAVHGANHRAPGLLRAIDGIQDVLNCRIGLENDFKRIIRGMAYPDCGIRAFQNEASYEKIRQYLTELDIVYSRSLGQDNNSFELPADWHNWIPTAHHNNPAILDWIKEFVNIDVDNLYYAARRPKLMYIWGHSSEFDKNDNWEHLTAICEALAGKEDIWYATNIEIYDYVKAYNSLILSADGTRVYNPTLVTVWFDVDGILYTIKSGETLIIG